MKNKNPRKKKEESSFLGRNTLVWVMIALLLFVLFNLFQNSVEQEVSQEIAYSDLLKAVETDEVLEVTLQGQEATARFRDGRVVHAYIPGSGDLVETLRKQNVRILVRLPEGPNPLLQILISWFPMLLLIGVWVFFMRQMQSGAGKAMGFGKSKARLLSEQSGQVTFSDVAGIDEAKAEVEEIVEFLQDPRRFQRLGGKIPKGVLLVGPPGTGKTLLARAIAGEAEVPFFTISGSDFVEMFVGVGASRVRDMFEQGKKSSPCIIFVDEIDAVGRHRGAGLGGGNDEREQTLNQLLVEMDGFESNAGVILIAATNRPDVLDPALLRPGRFDRQVVVPNPDINGRDKILKIHTRKIPLGPDVKLRTLARGTPGFSGADLANLANEAALIAARAGKRVVTMEEFELAKDKVLMGAERRSLAMSEEEKEITAYHEAGHALVSVAVPGNDPLHKVTIIPRGRALGVTMNLPERDRLGFKKLEMEARLATMYGGRAAEALIYGRDHITTGAANDIKQATAMARSMVTEYGMSEKLGPLRYDDNQEEVFLGHSVARQQHISESTARRIDAEIHHFATQAEAKARRVVASRKDDLIRIAKALLEYETLSGEDVATLLRGETIAPAKQEEKVVGSSISAETPSRKVSADRTDSTTPRSKLRPHTPNSNPGLQS